MTAQIQDTLETALNRFELKKVKTFETLDGHAVNAELYFNKKRVDSYRDEGVGGGALPLNFDSDGGKALVTYVASSNIKELMRNDGWDFLEIDEIDESCVVSFVVDALLKQREDKKFVAKLQRNTKNGLVYQLVPGEAIPIKWGKLKSLNELVRLKGGLGSLQAKYDEVAAKVKEQKGWIVNDADQLKALGVTVNPALHAPAQPGHA